VDARLQTRRAPFPTLPRKQGRELLPRRETLPRKRGREGPAAEPWEGGGFVLHPPRDVS
jgi:hypothetical protein